MVERGRVESGYLQRQITHLRSEIFEKTANPGNLALGGNATGTPHSLLSRYRAEDFPIGPP